MTPRAPLLALRDVRLGYRDVTLFDHVDLEVGAGDSIGIAGANGSGKTTLLRTLLGLVAPLTGRVEQRSSPRVRIGYVPQHDAVDLAWPLTALEVAQMGAEPPGGLLKRRPRDAAERARAALDRVGLSALERALFRSLSGGQRQRVLVARALATEPELLLLDEPTNNLDAQSVRELTQVFEDLHDKGTAIVIVSHAAEYLATLVERILVVDRDRRIVCWLGDEEIGRLRAAWRHDRAHGHPHESRPPAPKETTP